MNFPGIERSMVDHRWCVFTPTFEALCPWFLVPVVYLYAIFQ
tara:strand:- start:2601 stop:2726 length:126 start_codon:yes stop_codon:yes gene_type:complete